MEDGRGSSGIDSGKSIGLAEGILLPAEPVESNRSRPNTNTSNSKLVNNRPRDEMGDKGGSSSEL